MCKNCVRVVDMHTFRFWLTQIRTNYIKMTPKIERKQQQKKKIPKIETRFERKKRKNQHTNTIKRTNNDKMKLQTRTHVTLTMKTH